MSLPAYRLSRALAGLVLILCAGHAHSAIITINNGLGPPESSNVINAENSFPSDKVIVANVGCVYLVVCDSPGASTSVLLESGGVIGAGLGVNQTSSITMTGGSVTASSPDGNTSYALGADDYAKVTISGGDLGYLVAFGASTAMILGGSVESIESGGGTVTVRGGEIVRIHVFFGGTINIYGDSFSVDGVPVRMGAVGPDFGSLTGTLASGESLNVEFNRRAFGESPGSGFLILIPEPTTALLLGSGLAVLSGTARGASSWRLRSPPAVQKQSLV